MPTVNGEYFLPPVYEATPGDRIRADQHNIPLRDVAQGLTDRVMRDGTSPMTGNLPMNGHQIKGLAAGVANSDAARMDQVRGASWQMAPLTTTDDLNATIVPGVYAWDAPTAPQNVPVAASAATLLVTQGVNSTSVQQEWIERDGTRRMWRVRNGASVWLPWAEAVAGVDAEAMRAQVGITVGSDGLTRLNESVNHIDSSWLAGVSDVPGFASPKQIADAIGALAIGVGQTWRVVTASRTYSTSYQNTTGRPISVAIKAGGSGGDRKIETSPNAVNWVPVGATAGTGQQAQSFEVPAMHYYRINGAATIDFWSEMRND